MRNCVESDLANRKEARHIFFIYNYKNFEIKYLVFKVSSIIQTLYTTSTFYITLIAHHTLYICVIMIYYIHTIVNWRDLVCRSGN